MPGKKTNPSHVPKNAVLLSNVASLTLHDGKRTTSRRVSSVPQLECVGPKDVCKLYKVDVMRCTNEGADYDADNVQWACKASLPNEFKLGSTDVVCEGYESSDDPYVLKGSCAVEYRLLLTEAGERKYKAQQQHHRGSKWDMPTVNISTPNDSGSWAGMLFSLIFVIVLLVILNGIRQRWNDNRRRTGGGPVRPYGGDYGDDDNDNDPPPPYEGPPSYYNQSRKTKGSSSAPKRTTTTNTFSRGSSSRSAASQQQRAQPQGWRPGFWTGAAAGAATGYYAGSRNQSRRNETQERRQQQGRGWFSNFGGQQQQQPLSQQWTTDSSSYPTSSSSSTFSSTRYDSTGFGGTSRR